MTETQSGAPSRREKGLRLAVLNLTRSGISGGYKNYLQNMLPRLAADARVESLLCVSSSHLRMEDWAPRHQKIVFKPCPPFSLFNGSLKRELKRTLSSFSPDVIFVPTARAARFRDVPAAVMIQNMAPLVSWKAGGLLDMARLTLLRLETRKAARQADAVVAISDFVRQALRQKCEVPNNKIHLIYFGAPPPDLPARRPSMLPPDWSDFIFTAGSIEPYRGMDDLIEAAKHSSRSLGRPLKIAVAGSARKDMHPYALRLKAQAIKAGLSESLCWLGQLSSEEMTWCYKNCSAFVMTSRVEASPNIALEALASGAVCIAADNAPLPEFFADAALYYKPGDAAMLAARINDVRSWDTAKRGQVSSAAIERSHDFDWETTAKKTLELFEKIRRPRSGSVTLAP